MTRFELARDDLEIAPRVIDGETVYFVGDPIKVQYHRLDELQYLVFKKLDGKTSLEALSQWLNDEHGVEAPPEALAEFIGVLRGLNLLDLSTDTSLDAERGQQIAAKVKKGMAQDGVVFAKRKQTPPRKKERRSRREEARLFDLAIDHFERGEIAKCGAKLREVLRIEPKNARARYFLRALFSETLGKVKDQDSLLWWRIPIGNPDRMLARVDKAIGKLLFTPLTLWFVALSFIAGSILLLSDLDRFFVDMKRFFEFDWIFKEPLLPLFIWTLGPLQLFLHECGHGLACRHYGGRVREMGVLIVRFAPTAYCDISSTYLLENKWQRAITCYAGIFVDAVIWALFVLLYHVSEPTSVIGMLALISIPIKLESMVLGTIPLIRGDGYFALTELVNYPNLSDDARAYCGAKIRALITGEPARIEEGAASHARLFWTFTVGSIVVFTALLLPVVVAIVGYLVARLESIGVLLSATLLYFVFGRRVLAFFKAIWRERGALRTSRRARVVVSVAAIILIGVAAYPARITIDAPCRLRPDVQWLRAPFAGTVMTLDVGADAEVTEGQPLLALDTAQLTVDVARASSELRQAELDLQTLIAGASVAELGVSRAELAAAAAELAAASRDVASARARANAGGGREALDAALARQAEAQTRYRTAEKGVVLSTSGPQEEAVASAKARVASLQAQLADSEARLAQAKMTSPVDGVIVPGDVSLRELAGQKFERGALLVGVRRTNGDILEIRVPGTEPVSALAIGQEVRARFVGMPHVPVVAHVSTIGATVEKATGDDVFYGRQFLRVEAQLPELGGDRLPADLTGTAEIAGGRAPLIQHLWLRIVRLYELDIRPFL